MASKITITDTKNKVTIIPSSSNKVETSITNTPVTVTQGTTSVVTVNTLGPQGPQGNPGESPGFDDDIQVRHITASGNISASGDIIGKDIFGQTLFTDFGLFLRNSSLSDLAIQNETNTTGFIRFLTKREDTQVERLRISNNGNVGIGTNTPGEALEIVGNISASGNIFATSMSLGHVTNPLGQLHIADNGTEVGSNRFVVKIPDNSIQLGTQGGFFTDLKFSNNGGIAVTDTGNTDYTSFRVNLNRLETNKIRSGNYINNLQYSALDFESSLFGITTVDPAFTFKTFTNAGSLNRSRLEMYNGDSGAVILQPSHSSGNVGIGTNSTPGEKLTVSGSISASGDVYAQNIRIPIDAASPGKIIGNDNKSFQLEDGGGFARIDVFRGFKVVTNEGTTSQKARFGLDKVEITNADFSVDGHITASGDISASGDITANQMLLQNHGSVILTLNSTQNGQSSRINLREDGNQFGAYMMYDSSDFHIGSIDSGADTDSIIIAREGDVTFNHNVQIGNQKTLTVLLDNDRTTPSFTVQDENTSDSVFSISGDGSGNPIANLVLTGSVNIVPSGSIGGHITASANISASGDIFADTASFFNIILDHKGTAEPTINFKSDGGPNFTFGFSGDNVLRLSGETGTTGQVFELASEVETFRIKQGGTILIQRGSGTGTSGTGSKHDGGLFIEAQNTDSSNGKAAQFTALSTGGILKNTSFGGTGKHGTFKFINGGNLNNDVDATEHIVAEFGPTSSAHFTFHVPITASGNISASGDITAGGANIIGTTKIKGDVSMGPQGDAGLVAKDDSGNNFTLSLRDTTPSMVFNDQTGTVGRGEIEFVGQAATSESNFIFNATSGSHGEPATYQFQLQGEEIVRFTTSSVVLDYDKMPTADPGVKGTIYRSSSAGIDNLLFISPGS